MNDYTGWNRPMVVTLTGTANPYLADRLPLRGLLKVLETRTDGSASPLGVIFSETRPDGSQGAYVAVDWASWAVTTEIPEEARRGR